MFFCFGENENVTQSIGKGDTIADAIRDWAYNTYWHEIETEFNTYNPTIIEGTPLNVNLTVPDPLPIIEIYS